MSVRSPSGQSLGMRRTLLLLAFLGGCATPSPYRAQAEPPPVVKLAPETAVAIAKGPRKGVAVKDLEGSDVTLSLATTRVRPVVRGRGTRWFGPDFWASVTDTRLFVSDDLGGESFPLGEIEYVASSWVRENPERDDGVPEGWMVALKVLGGLCGCLLGGFPSF